MARLFPTKNAKCAHYTLDGTTVLDESMRKDQSCNIDPPRINGVYEDAIDAIVTTVL
jgi:hypothetical protein